MLGVFEFFEREVVKYRITRAQTGLVGRSASAEAEHNVEGSGGNGRCFDENFVSFPFALGVDAFDFRVSVGAYVNASTACIFVVTADVVGEYVDFESVISTFFKCEGSGGVAISRRTVNSLAVCVFTFFGHIHHKGVLVNTAIVVSSGYVQQIIQRVLVVVPLALVGVVERFVKTDDARRNVGLVIAGRVHLRTRPTRKRTRVGRRCGVDHVEVAVFDEEIFGLFILRRIRRRSVVVVVSVASDEQAR